MTDSQRYPFLDAYGIFPPHTPPPLVDGLPGCGVSRLPIRWSVTSWDAWSPGVAAAI